VEWRLAPEGTVPEWTTPDWYATMPNSLMADGPTHGPRVRAAADMVTRAAHRVAARTVVDLGAGDGGLLQLLTQTPIYTKAWGYDLQPSHVDHAPTRGVNVQLLDILTHPEAVDWGEAPRVVVATEMLEHLLDPHALLRSIPAGSTLVASSPYTETGAQHYVFHAWAWDMGGYRDLMRECGWARIIEHVTVPPIFQVIACER
jgi:trans-aconitate methyltransferase